MSLLATILHNQPIPLPTGTLRTIKCEDRVYQRSAVSANSAEAGKITRRYILTLLEEGPASLPEITAEMDITSPRVRRHLEILMEEGKVTRYENADNARDAAKFIYQLAPAKSKGSQAIKEFILEQIAKGINTIPAMALNTHHCRSNISRIAEKMVEEGTLTASKTHPRQYNTKENAQ